jgi:hypothetical protein
MRHDKGHASSGRFLERAVSRARRFLQSHSEITQRAGRFDEASSTSALGGARVSGARKFPAASVAEHRLALHRLLV